MRAEDCERAFVMLMNRAGHMYPADVDLTAEECWDVVQAALMSAFHHTPRFRYQNRDCLAFLAHVIRMAGR